MSLVSGDLKSVASCHELAQQHPSASTAAAWGEWVHSSCSCCNTGTSVLNMSSALLNEGIVDEHEGESEPQCSPCKCVCKGSIYFPVCPTFFPTACPEEGGQGCVRGCLLTCRNKLEEAQEDRDPCRLLAACKACLPENLCRLQRTNKLEDQVWFPSRTITSIAAASQDKAALERADVAR